MATNIGNSAFGMALRRLLVLGVCGGNATTPPSGYTARGRHIFWLQYMLKNTQFFKQSFALLTHLLACLLLLAPSKINV